MLSLVPTILVDTREKDPWEFKGLRVRLKPQALSVGDYSVQGMQSCVAIERKSVEDLFHTMTAGLERFRRELERSMDGGMRFLAVVVEGDMARVSLGSRYSWADPARTVSQLYKVCVRAGAAPYFCAGRGEAERLGLALLEGFWAGRPRRIQV